MKTEERLGVLNGKQYKRCIEYERDADEASRCGSDCFFVLVLPLVPDLPRKSLPSNGGTHPRRAGANGSVNRAISLRAPSHVCQLTPLLPKICPLAGIVDRSAARASPRGWNCKAGGA
jgi:hypothetical protein